MYLKQLTLKGFKSFAQPTTFVFEPGVTCVIGPNGSGKSNVVDALSWVMGEQGAKNLRGGTMEDVIFAGTATRGPLGRAEVRLTIDNADGALPIEYSEVTISRTLFRNGGSEYAINGESCRLLDVQELLSDSGLGREMHVIVGQGQLDTLLRANPEGRRGFIEEAAGILKHRRRKEKTVRKLEAMQTNLTRLSDLAGEVRRQLKPLGRQAEIARQAQTVAATARDAKARLLADDVVAVRVSLEHLTRAESENHSEHIVVQEQLEQKTLVRERLEKDQESESLDVIRQVVFSLEQARDRLRSLFTLATQRRALLAAEPDLSVGVDGVTERDVDDSRAEIERLTQVVTDANVHFEACAEAARQARARLDAVDEEIAAQSALISRYDLEMSALSGKADAEAAKLASVRAEVLRHETARDAAIERRDMAQRELAQRESEAKELGSTQTDLSEAYERAQTQTLQAEAENERLREELHAAERERDALVARESVLSRALDHKDGAGTLVGRDQPGVIGLVADHVVVQQGFETAVAAALGTLADALLVASSDAAFAAIETSRNDELGRIDAVIANAPFTQERVIEREGVVSALSVIDAPSGVCGLLASVLIADDLDAARVVFRELISSEKGSLFTIVTRTGDVVSERVLRGGSLAQQSRIELRADRDAARERLADIVLVIRDRQSEREQQQTILAAAKERAAATLSALREYDSSLAARTQALSRARAAFDAAQAEYERFVQVVEQATSRVDDAESAARNANAEVERARSAPRPILDASAREGLALELDETREREVQARLNCEAARERVRVETARRDALTEQLAKQRAAAEQAARRRVIRQRQRAAAEAVCDALPAVISSADRSLAAAQEQLATARNERSRQNEQLERVRREEAELRQRLAQITERVHGGELHIYEKKMHLSSLLERAGSELGFIEDVLVAEYGPQTPVPLLRTGGEEISALDQTAAGVEPSAETVPYVRAEQQKRLEAAERALAQLGRVNPLALEEFAALEQRHAFLTEQLTDLTKTRADLLTIIEEVDEKMQSVFLAAFEDTKVAFDRVFPILFPGGTGSITLTDPDNLLETGIEVAVKPAGKKIERLSLLSGGERSLAALAFLVAIFTARPSPFYIMDEVEAALDDANLGRLLTIFETLRESSQLIVITHQKRTMEIADALYGVSMRQDGVSAVIGQRVDDPEHA